MVARVSVHLVVVAVALGVHLACGGGGAGRSEPATTHSADRSEAKGDAKGEREVATGSTLTEFQKRRLLGHYSTRDGASGFILDRTTTPWRVKLDGVDSVRTMAKTNTPRRGESEYKSDDGNLWIRVEDESGEVLLFDGPKQNEGVAVTRDADAKQLR